MNFLGPTRLHRLNEAVAVVFLFVGLIVTLSLASYHETDGSWNTATGILKPQNLIGHPGAYLSDLCLQTFGLASLAIPFLLFALAWKWLRSTPIESPVIKLAGSSLILLAGCAGLAMLPFGKSIGGVFPAGGMFGMALADYLVALWNPAGAAILIIGVLILSLYLVSTFTLSMLASWFRGPLEMLSALKLRYREWSVRRAAAAAEKVRIKAEKKRLDEELDSARPKTRQVPREVPEPEPVAVTAAVQPVPAIEPPPAPAAAKKPTVDSDATLDDIPIRTLESLPPTPAPPLPPMDQRPPWESPAKSSRPAPPVSKKHASFKLPSMTLLHEPQARSAYDTQELKDTAAQIKNKFEEFSVHGSVTQINPGPVVTTFEFKPEAGIKYSRITTLSEDLCLGLQAESILIERIPGKPTVGIEVPNTKREVISLREILESEEFQNSPSPLTIALGKDINGRIRVAALDSMPHLLIAGSTGSGKSVMLNSMIMSILYKSTPDEVRMIMVDPKRLELGLYEGIPHLLTPVITDPKKATNALRNAVIEMERRLKLLAAQGVRNIDQYNRKIRKLAEQPRSLFEDDAETEPEELKPLPYILILIDELADLMMLERANVEESVARLAQMARAVGMHLVLATQRPSVDVITGLIKANFPSRISFRVATRVDSRTVLDVMGAEHLLGKGDMLFLPPGSSRLTRVHGAYVTESETNDVVEYWKQQATPEYDKTFLLAPPTEEEEGEGEEFNTEEDPMYHDAVRVVLEMGKASTSTLQRRLRLGYGRAARILDMMQREGIIGPPDGSKAREVLKTPDWLNEVESSLR